MQADMAQISYIAHKKRMFKAYRKAYQREMRLKIALIASNVLWIICFIALMR